MVSATIFSIALNERSWIGDWEKDADIGLPGRPAWARIAQRELDLEAPDYPHPVRRKSRRSLVGGSVERFAWKVAK